MATVLIPTAAGGRKPVEVSPGASAASVLAKNGSMQQAARNGLERFNPSTQGWEKVQLSYLVKEGDKLRVAFPKQQQAGGAIGRVLTDFFLSLRRRRGNPRDRGGR